MLKKTALRAVPLFQRRKFRIQTCMPYKGTTEE